MAKDGGPLLRQKSGEMSTTVNTVISSFEEEEDTKDVNVINSLDCKSYILLRRYFFNPTLLRGDGSLKSKDQEKMVPSEALSRTDFVMAVKKLNGELGIAASRLFDVLDKSQYGYITWQEFLDHSLQLMNVPEAFMEELIIPGKAECHRIKHFAETDGIAKIIPLRIGFDHGFEVVSLRGLVSRYDAKFKVVPNSEYSVPLWGRSGEVTASAQGLTAAATHVPRLQSSKTAQPWITDITFMDDTCVIVFAASDRSLHFRDAGVGRGAPWMFHVSGLRNVPTCLAYMSPAQNGSVSAEGQQLCSKEGSTSVHSANTDQSKGAIWTDSVLLIGDDKGNIWTLKFLCPKEGLFHRSRRRGEGAEQISWQDLERETILRGHSWRAHLGGNATPSESLHRKHAELSVAWRVHRGPVSQVSFCGCTPFAVASCSSADRLPFSKELGKGSHFEGGGSLILKTESSRAAPYVFKIPCGISCFDLWENEKGLDCYLLATGSSDGIIRLWNPYNPKKVTANLTGHRDPIKDVTFMRRADSMILVTICSRAEIRIWDTSDNRCHENFCCLQVFHTSFSAISSPNKMVHFGSKVLYVLERQPTSLLVACGIEIITLEFASRGKSLHMQTKAGMDSSLKNAFGGAATAVPECEGEDGTLSALSCPTECGMGQPPGNGGHLEVHTISSDRKLSIFLRATQSSKPVTKCPGINQRQSQQRKCQDVMKAFVSLCTPHLALPVHSPQSFATQPSRKTRAMEVEQTVNEFLKIGATIPFTTATCDHSFSTLRRMKSYIRSSTAQDRLNGLASLSVHQDVPVNPEEVLNKLS